MFSVSLAMAASVDVDFMCLEGRGTGRRVDGYAEPDSLAVARSAPVAAFVEVPSVSGAGLGVIESSGADGSSRRELPAEEVVLLPDTGARFPVESTTCLGATGALT